VKPLDRFIQRLRIRQAVRHVPDDARVLDVGCFDTSLFDAIGPRLGAGVGVDPHIERETRNGNVVLKSGSFPDVDVEGPFDCICMLAVVEHIPREKHTEVSRVCAELLKPGGRLIVTVPSPIVDRVASLLARLRLIDGIDLDQHYGLAIDEMVAAFSERLRLTVRRRFELGLNNLLVFER
jgi:SAM-dependent methyltransferase